MHNWVVDMEAKLNQARFNNLGNGWSQEEQLRRMKTTIYKVPPFISNINKKAYQPQVVSFGPYHHGEPLLASMEAHKERALFCYIHRSGRPMQEVVEYITSIAKELKNSYDSLDSKWQDNIEGFVQLMILDGCFMLELLRVAYQPKNYYPGDDPIFSQHGDLYVMPFIKADMLLLENQLPMLLLLSLKHILENAEGFALALPLTLIVPPDIEKLNENILRLLHHDHGHGHDSSYYSKLGQCLHVLDLYRKDLLHTHTEHENATPQSPDQGEGKDKWVGHNVVRPATELHEAGVRFMKSESKSLQDITFDGGILKLPNFIVDDHTESMFLNLIAFERCYNRAGSDITSFVSFMNYIIDDSQDIKLLSSNGIINNFIGTDKEAADLFNTVSKDLIMKMSGNLDRVYKNLTKHCNTPWHKWLANLTQTYFKNPWAIISVIAAILLFSLTIVQTVYTILPS